MTARAPSIAVIGAGGLGGPIAFALAAAGCSLRLVDFDVVELSNLQRQVQFTMADLGRPKALALHEALRARFGGDVSRFAPIGVRFEPEIADGIAGAPGHRVDAIVDGTDSPATKFAVADWAIARGVPYVIAAALRYGGNVFAGDPRATTPGGTACYRCLFEAPPGADDLDAPTCADAGILGPVCACVGGLAARELLRLVAGDTKDAGTILVVDDLRAGFRPRRVSFRPRAGCSCAVRKTA